MPQEEHKNHERALARLNRLAGLAWLALFSERLWRRLWPPVGMVLLFLSLSWLGLWQMVGNTAHLIGLILFALGFLYSCRSFLSLRRPALDEALQRVDRDSGLPHGDAAAMNDRLALGRENAVARGLWILHRKRVVATVPKMRVGFPEPDMPRYDRYAIRSGLVLLAVASAFIAGPDKDERLATAFTVRMPGVGNNGNTIAMSGWINPPGYTGLPPQAISFATPSQNLRAPVGATLVIRTARDAVSVSATPALPRKDAAPASATEGTLDEHILTLDRDAEITVSSGFFSKHKLAVAIIPDVPPTVAVKGDIVVNQRGSFVLPYGASDDYGVTDITASFALDPAYRSLVPAPDMPLAPPPRTGGGEAMRRTIDLAEHPWAGLPVTMTLTARDAIGQQGRSEPLRFVLPQRPFTVPLAQALAELRRRLITETDGQKVVASAIDGLMTAPELFTPEAGVYLGLRQARLLVRTAKTNQNLIALSEWLWAMAVKIEDGTLSGAERDLKAAREKLQDAIARNADPKEIAQLTQDMREAMNRYLQELAQRMQQGDKNAETPLADGRMVSPDQLTQMLDRIEELMRQGRTAEAQQMMDELRNIFENMQTARPNGGMDPMMKEMMEAMNQADSLLSQQQKLRDETYERNRQRLMYPDEKKPEDMPGMADMEPRQKSLRESLEALKRQGRKLGIAPDSNLDDAEQAMREAEEALNADDGSEAIEAQGRAIEALQKGAKNMMQQAQNMLGTGAPMAGGTREGGTQNPNPFNGKANTKDVRDRLQELIETLRQKLADPSRPKDELDYFDRLLRQ